MNIYTKSGDKGTTDLVRTKMYPSQTTVFSLWERLMS